MRILSIWPKTNFFVLKILPLSLLKQRDFVLSILQANPGAILHAPHEIKYDKTLVPYAMLHDPTLIHHGTANRDDSRPFDILVDGEITMLALNSLADVTKYAENIDRLLLSSKRNLVK